MKIVTVIPLRKGTWSEDLTYFSAKEIQNGSIVTVPLRKKNILGLVISVEDASEAKINIKDFSFNLKKVIDVKTDSIFRREYLDSALEVGKYFSINKNTAVTSLIPNILIEHYDKIALSIKERPELENSTNAPVKIKAEKLLLQLPFTDRISIYKTLIRENFALKKSVFIVLPTEQDTKIFFEALSRGIEQFTYTVHSGYTTKKAMALIKDIANSTHPLLILGTAPYLSIPRPDLGVIILEHESSSVYKTASRPQIDLRTFVEVFAAKIYAKFISSDTLLRFETISRRDSENLQPMHPLSFRIDFRGEINIESTNRENTDKKFTVLSEATIAEIQKTIEFGKNVFIFSLRKGLATMTVCRDCSTMLACKTCGAPVVLYNSRDGKKRMLICNRCKVELDADTNCETCGSWNLAPLGIGTDTVYEYLKERLESKTKIFKLDKESAKSAKGAEEIITEFESSKGAILIGTEMAFFYLENKVELSVVASFDSLWSIPNFKMSEKILQLIISILEKTENKLIIQTKNDTDNALLAIKNGYLLSFVREEIDERKKLEYPPFKRFIKLTYLGNKSETQKLKEFLADFFADFNPEIFSGFHAKLKDKYVTNTLIKIAPENWSLEDINHGGSIDEKLSAKLLSLPPNFTISVDPEDLL